MSETQSPGELFEQAFSDDEKEEVVEQAAPEGEAEVEEPETETQDDSQESDPLEGLPDDVRSLVEDHQKKLKQAEDRLAAREREFHALHNRLAPTQQKLAEYERLLKKDTPVSDDGKAADSLDKVLNSPKFKRYAEQYPEDAEAIQEALSLVWQSNESRYKQLETLLREKVEPTLNNMTRESARREFEQGLNRLNEEHPDWKEIQEQQEFWAWFDEYRSSQPSGIRERFYDNKELGRILSEANFVIPLLHSYKRDLWIANQEQPSQKPKQVSKVHAAPKVNGGTPVRRISTDNMSDGELFEHLMSQ